MVISLRYLLSISASLLIAPALLCSSAYATETTTEDLLNLPLEKLAQVKVTSVSKKEETLNSAAAAAYVISSEDIKRSGLTSIPEILRLAPGVNVARVGSSSWAISVRGFNGQFANKLLVLIDGRSVYTPFSSGVYWDVQDTMIEDIDRIEIIRGPGATLWGANAVNGVINIITKHTKDTQGGLVVAGAGTEEKLFTNNRYGGKISEDAHYRVYGKYFSRNDTHDFNRSNNANDEWQKGQGGFRIDWDKSTENNLTFQGDIYNGNEDIRYKLPMLTSPFSFTSDRDNEISGGNALSRWEHHFSNGSESTLQVYYDVASRGTAYVSQLIKTLDIDFQHIWDTSERNEVTWGLGFRNVKDEYENTTYTTISPIQDNKNLYSLFLQDKYALVPEKVFFTLGSKFEHNEHTGVELQPSARIAWLVDHNQTLWASIARAIRTPSRIMDDVSYAFAGTPFGFARLVGNPQVESERMIAYEVGYRTQPRENLSFDITGFLNVYDNLASNEAVNPITFKAGNRGAGKSHGIEVSSILKATDTWNLSASYTFINIKLDGDIESSVNSEKQTPQQQFNLASHYNIKPTVRLDNMLYLVDDLNALGIDGYVRFDTQLSWEIKQGITLSLVGQNLTDSRHKEFVANISEVPSEIGRSVYAKAAWVF